MFLRFSKSEYYNILFFLVLVYILQILLFVLFNVQMIEVLVNFAWNMWNRESFATVIISYIIILCFQETFTLIHYFIKFVHSKYPMVFRKFIMAGVLDSFIKTNNIAESSNNSSSISSINGSPNVSQASNKEEAHSISKGIFKKVWSKFKFDFGIRKDVTYLSFSHWYEQPDWLWRSELLTCVSW